MLNLKGSLRDLSDTILFVDLMRSWVGAGGLAAQGRVVFGMCRNCKYVEKLSKRCLANLYTS